MKKLVKYAKQNSISNKNFVKYPPSYPNEMMVKILSSPFYSNVTDKKFFKKKNLKILEIGSSSGNNLRYFLEKIFSKVEVFERSELSKISLNFFVGICIV